MECSAGSDICRTRECVNSLLQDKQRLAQMSAIDHLMWARELPPCGGMVDLPVLLRDAVDRAAELDEAALSSKRLEAKDFWVERKRVLDLEWAERFRTLPEHVRSVLGPK